MNSHAIPFVREASKRCDQLRQLMRLAMRMKHNPKAYGLDDLAVDKLDDLEDDTATYIVQLLNTAAMLLTADNRIRNAKQVNDSDLLPFPQFTRRAGETPPDDAG